MPLVYIYVYEWDHIFAFAVSSTQYCHFVILPSELCAQRQRQPDLRDIDGCKLSIHQRVPHVHRKPPVEMHAS